MIVYGLAKALESGTPESDRIAWHITRHYHDTDEEARRYQESISDLDLVLIKVTSQRLVGPDYGADASRVLNS